jgi:hypothetical protein
MAINDAMQITFSAAILSIGVYSETHERVFVRWNESRTQIITSVTRKIRPWYKECIICINAR